MPDRSRTKAIVLSRTALGESDWIVTLLSETHGKFRAVAPGGRRSKRRFAGCLELFCSIEVEFVERKNGLHRLEEAVLLASRLPISKDLVSIAHAGYLAELAGAFLGEADEAGRFFELLSAALARLESGPLAAVEIRRYELEVLELAGLAPSFSGCCACGCQSAQSWMFDQFAGAVYCSGCALGKQLRPISSETLELLAACQARGHEIPTVDAQSMAAARALLADIIDGHLARPLRARDFLRKLAGTAE